MIASDKNIKKQSSLKDLPGSFRHAFSGIIALIKSEYNARIHLVILILVVIAGIVLKISPAHWIAVLLVSGLVIASECFNTALEYLSDVVAPDTNPMIRKAKDVAAAGVLVSALTAAITGLIIFIPAILRFFD
jgi:diacylglycerol kinase